MLQRTDIDNEISNIEGYIQSVSNELNTLIKKVPEGAKLRSAKHKNGFQYFMRLNPSDINGEYIKTKDRKRAILLAQIEYDEKLLAKLQESLAALTKLKTNCTDAIFESTINSLSLGKRELITQPYTTDEEFVTSWKNKAFTGLDFNPDYPEYYTRQNLRVRSKSEVIIADILDESGIPFLYEKPLMLKSGTVHPDFTLLNVKTRHEVYWEHLGMMDDIDYRNNAFLKLRNYEAGGFYPYESIIWTFETSKYPLNTKDLRKMVKNLKVMLGY